MPFDIKELLERHRGENHDLHEQHVNPQFTRVLRTIGFNKCYVEAHGAHLIDTAGDDYLDMLSGYGVFTMGRNHPDIRRALVEFMDLEYPSLVQMEAPLLSGLLASELKKRVDPSLDTVYFTSSGTEAIETAIKLARGATGRPAMVHCEKAFHGLTTGALSLNGDPSFRDGFAPFLPEGRMIPYGDLEALAEALAPGDVAAFVVEPIQGKGVNIPASDFLREAGALCQRHGTLLVFDEVQTGLGRTGRFLASEHDDAVADIVTLSKALSGGFVPVGAVLYRRAIYEKVFSSMDRAVVHSSTFGQGSLAMVAGLATLQLMDDEDLSGNATRMGEALLDGLKAMVPRFEYLKDVRGRGLMIGIEFGEPESFGLRKSWQAIHKMDANLFCQAVVMPLMEDHRIISQVAGHNVDIVKLLPPLIISEDDVRRFLTAFEAVMESIHKFPGPLWVLKRLAHHAIGARSREKTEQG